MITRFTDHDRTNAMVDLAKGINRLIEKTIEGHGANDPRIKDMLLGVMVHVVGALNEEIDKDFGELLGKEIYRRFIKPTLKGNYHEMGMM